MILRHDFQNIPEDAEIILHPAEANLIHREPVKANRIGDYFYCDGTNLERGPDYYLVDVAAFCRGWEAVEVAA